MRRALRSRSIGAEKGTGRTHYSYACVFIVAQRAHWMCNTTYGVRFRTVFKCSDQSVYFRCARLLIEILFLNLACARTDQPRCVSGPLHRPRSVLSRAGFFVRGRAQRFACCKGEVRPQQWRLQRGEGVRTCKVVGQKSSSASALTIPRSLSERC